jgi:hypothetical protein
MKKRQGGAGALSKGVQAGGKTPPNAPYAQCVEVRLKRPRGVQVSLPEPQKPSLPSTTRMVCLKRVTYLEQTIWWLYGGCMVILKVSSPAQHHARRLAVLRELARPATIASDD